MYCPKCGQQNADDATFCQKCGADLKVTAAPMGGGMPGSTPSSSYSGANPMPTSFNFMATVKHAIDLVKSPVAVMTAYKDSDPSLNSLMIYYVAVLAVFEFVGTLIGNAVFYNAGYGISSAILYYIFDIVQVFVVGFIIWKLAPNFGTSTSQVRATKLAAYAFTPYLLISILKIIPFIGFLAILGLLYGLYILYLGLPVLLGAPQSQTLTYFIVILVVTFVVYAIIGVVIGAITFAAFDYRGFLFV